VEKSPVKSKHVTIEAAETLDTEVADDGHGNWNSLLAYNCF